MKVYKIFWQREQIKTFDQATAPNVVWTLAFDSQLAHP